MSFINRIRIILRDNERGFTLLEMIVALGILGFISGAMAMTTATIMQITPQSNNQVVTLRQVQNAGLWISRDVQMAQTVDTSPITGEFLKLTFAVVGSADTTVFYKLEDMTGGMKKLVRVGPSDQMLVAESIYYNPTDDPANSTIIISYLNSTLTVRVTVKLGSTTVSRQYETRQRVPVAP